jgi:hypothetical protein
MIQPTLKNVKIRSTKDACQVFSAVVNGNLPLISTRLTREEGKAIESGDIYVWEERGSDVPRTTGIRRWTDGMHWKRRTTRGVSVDTYIILRILIQLRFQGFMYYDQKSFRNTNDIDFYVTSPR